MKLPRGQVCYLCGTAITEGQAWNRDHVPPQRIFGQAVRAEHNPQLEWLYTHTACNSAYRDDEEYFVVSFAGQAQSETGAAVIADLKRAYAKGHSRGLIRETINRFESVRTSEGLITFQYDSARTNRVVWKLTRGLYFKDVGVVLPDTAKHVVVLTNRVTAERIIMDTVGEVYPHVRDTESMGTYGAVFDYKWLGVRDDDGAGRMHAMAMLLWDGILAFVIFHDPTCRCVRCISGAQETNDRAAH